MLIMRKPVTTRDYMVTIAIGEKYLHLWRSHASLGWLNYCKKYDLGLIVLTEDLIDNNNLSWKKATWQKLLIGNYILNKGIDVENIVYLDTDILVGPYAKNVFSIYEKESVGLVSKRKNLPFPLELILKKIAYNRHYYYSKKYPLDSALFISLSDLYSYHGMDVMNDEACMGFIVFNKIHFDFMEKCFYKYPASVQSITNGGDQTHLNYELQKYKNIQWYPYEYQAIWVYEMAANYSFLYKCDLGIDKSLVASCIGDVLVRSNFLHFAGSWGESFMWTCFDDTYYGSGEILSFEQYLGAESIGMPLGFVKG